MNLSVSDETFFGVLAILGFVFMHIALIALGIMLTKGFRKSVEVEKLCATPGSEMQKWARIMGTQMIGRMVRITVVTSFLVQRRFSGWGVRRAAKLGDVEATVPPGMSRWVVIPQLIFAVSTILAISLGLLIKWLDEGILF